MINSKVIAQFFDSKKQFVLGVFMVFGFSVFGGSTFVIDGEFEPTRLTPYLQVFESPEDLNPELVWLEMGEHPNVYGVSSTSFGFSNHFFWLKFSVQNNTSVMKENVISINNPHLDFVKIWENSPSDGLDLIYMGGDGMPFYERTINNRNIVMPISLSPGELKSYLIQVDKRSASVSVPIQITSKKQFEKFENESLFAFGMYFGILLLIILFSLFVFFIIRHNIFFWYAFYLTFLGMYLLAHVGLFFQIGYPNQNWFNDYSRPIFITLSTTALLHFIRLLLNVETLLPKWNKYFDIIIVFLGVITFYWFVTPWWHSVQTIIYLNAQNITLLLSLVLVLIISVLTFKKQKVLVIFFWIAFMAVLSAGMSIILVESGLMNESFIAINPLFFGSMIEAVVFAIGLSYWSKINDKERVKLIDMIQHSKKQMIDSYIHGVEREKEKIASDLHDDIGSRLGHLKRQLEKDSNTSKESIDRVVNLVKRVRRISHELSPPSFQTDEFLVSIRHLIFTHQTEGLQINFQLFDLPNNLNRDMTKQLYRIIQSALNSIEKHAKASMVDVQFFYHKAELVLAIEDNGVGFNFNKDAPGLTMKEMINRVEIMNGKIEISSSKRHGTSIMINVPISGD